MIKLNKDFKIPKFFIVKIVENFNSLQNSLRYIKDSTIIVQESNDLDQYLVVNTNDSIPVGIANKLYQLELSEEAL